MKLPNFTAAKVTVDRAIEDRLEYSALFTDVSRGQAVTAFRSSRYAADDTRCAEVCRHVMIANMPADLRDKHAGARALSTLKLTNSVQNANEIATIFE